MNGCIEREKALNLIDRYWQQAYLANFTDTALWLGSVYREIDNIPTADVSPVVRAKWVTPTVIGGRAFNIPHCSACNGVPCGVDEHTNFCPNCGADMRIPLEES